ncbi:hypothetical protein TrLO_g11164 [Triparma laevis f. longispina]|uniref:Fluoride ion transporter CrcB n=1 Tax=Triparma laevis f. longispina TaxID=1714387 RepID=A0A9W7FE56_9STRA|nr:hypothetical protein TrLO_g11164 [Triparma laevis f. longispina]
MILPTAIDFAALTVGASLGASTRHIISQNATKSSTFGPLHIAKINIIGSLLLGTLAGANKSSLLLPATVTPTSKPPNFLPNPRLTLLLGVGFCGSLTTFSTFSMDMITLLESGKYLTCLRYFALNNVGGVAAAGVGYFGARKLLKTWGALRVMK